MSFYQNYHWCSGKPKGIQKLLSNQISSTCYKVVSDPYNKRISIEQYKKGSFNKIIYDSALFDFRHMLSNDPLKAVWQTELIHQKKALIRDENDRIVLIESYRFNQDLCRQTDFITPHGTIIGIQKMFYTKLKDPLDGVVVFDQNEKPVLIKLYSTDKDTGAYTQIQRVIDTPHKSTLLTSSSP